MLDYNPQLAIAEALGDAKGGPSTIEDPDRVENRCWQTRPAPLTAYEESLADALQAIFGEEAYALPDIVERLNQMKLMPPGGAAVWTEESFRTEIARLAGAAGR